MLKMEDDWNGQMGFQDRSSELNSSRSLAEKAVPDIAMNSSHGGRMGSSYGSGWDPIGSPSQGANFGASLMVSHGNFSTPLYPVVSDNMRLRSTSQFMPHYSPVNTNAVEMLPKLSGFGGAGGGSLSGVMDPYGLSGCAQNSGSSNKIIMEPRQSEDDYQISKLTSMEASPTGKRKRNAEGEQERDASNDTSDEKESVKRKKKIEENIDSDQRSKQTDGQTKESSVDGEASKENYVHVRARRGQATNSHSLAERVRREKINDRMKLLQELVPGCNKITGKAVMLDEIINYVQSLQQQVEFLSMKLAAVNPEVNFDIEQILSKDILHSKGSNAPFIGLNLNPGMSSSHLGTTGIHQGALPYHPAPQGMWDGDLQSLLHMGFDLNPNLGPNGSSKT